MLYRPQFPQALSDTAAALLQKLGKSQALEPCPGFTVRIDGELLHAPYRVYYDERELQQCIQKSSGPTQQLALCLGSRHANGRKLRRPSRSVIWLGPEYLSGQSTSQPLSSQKQTLQMLYSPRSSSEK